MTPFLLLLPLPILLQRSRGRTSTRLKIKMALGTAIQMVSSAVPQRPLPSVVSPNPFISAPRLTRVGYGRKEGGVQCLWCRCFTCLHVEFLRRTPGILKISEAVLGSICQWLLLDFGWDYSRQLGESYSEFLITVSFCLINTVLLICTYLISSKSYHLIRSSFYETAFNLLGCVFYFTSSAYLAVMVNLILFPQYLIMPFFQVFPALTAAYVLGFVAGMVHGFDAYMAYRYYKGYR